MVKAIDDIFRHVEGAENPQDFRVSSKPLKEWKFTSLKAIFVPEFNSSDVYGHGTLDTKSHYASDWGTWRAGFGMERELMREKLFALMGRAEFDY